MMQVGHFQPQDELHAHDLQPINTTYLLGGGLPVLVLRGLLGGSIHAQF